MINITNNIEAKKVDDILINKYLIPELILIENAANAILNSLDLDKYNDIIVICGPGNNGADGLALARLLNMKNKNVKLICPYNKTIHYDICKKLQIKFIDKIENCDLIIDAIFGTGIDKKIDDPYKSIIEDVNKNRYKAKLISIDLVTKGLLKVDKLLMLSSFKEEVLNMNIEYEVLDIGVNKYAYTNASNKFLVDKQYIKSITKELNLFASKKDYGISTIVAKKGAAILACKASIKTGAGYTILLSDTDTLQKNMICNNEALNMELEYKIDKKNIAIGPNMGLDENNILYITENIDKDLIIDADLITILSKNKDIIKKLNENCIITPHIVEFCRLTGETLDSLISNPFDALKRFKNDFKGIVVLKGKNNIIYDGKNFYVVNIANSKMARAGMGDTLLGIISSYKAQGYSSLHACILGVYKQAEVGELLAKNNDVVTPTMLIDKL